MQISRASDKFSSRNSPRLNYGLFLYIAISSLCELVAIFICHFLNYSFRFAFNRTAFVMQ